MGVLATVQAYAATTTALSDEPCNMASVNYSHGLPWTQSLLLSSLDLFGWSLHRSTFCTERLETRAHRHTIDEAVDRIFASLQATWHGQVPS